MTALRYIVLGLVGLSLVQAAVPGRVPYSLPSVPPPRYVPQPKPVWSAKAKNISTDFPPLTIVSLKNYPQVVKSGENLTVEGSTLTFTPQAGANYAWNKSALEWDADYDGEEPVPVPADFLDFKADPVALPFPFPFFGTFYNTLYLSSRLELAFPKAPGNAKPCQWPALTDCAPRIFGTGGMQSNGHFFVKKTATDLLVTYLSDPVPDMPWKNIEVQFRLQPSGMIKISYKALQNPYAHDFFLGVYSGTSQSLQTSALNDPKKISGGGPGAQSKSLVYAGKGFVIDPVPLHKILVAALPQETYDAVLILSDFAYASEGTTTGMLAGTLGAQTRIMYNDVQGIGFPLYCEDNDCDTWSHAQAFMHLKNIRSANPAYATVAGNGFYHAMLHEFGHKWGAFLNYSSGKCVGPYTTSQCHWEGVPPAAYDAADISALAHEGVSGHGYSMMDLYAMGLAPSGAVKPYNGLTIEYVQQKLGPRVPAFNVAKKTFNIGAVMLTQRDVGAMAGDTDLLNIVRGYLNGFAAHVAKITLGQATIAF